MFIPLRTDRLLKRRPVVTEMLIIVNIFIHVGIMAGHAAGMLDLEQIYAAGQFDPQRFQIHRLLTYQFLHDPNGLGGLLHIGSNMLFLWIFGAPVEDRLGRFGFLGFYLIGGSVAALVHMMGYPNPAIGASGSVAAITGAFLAYFPRSQVKMLVIFLIIGVITVPSLFVVGFYVAYNILRQLMEMAGQESDVAYLAHLGGYTYGFMLAFVLLASGVSPRGEFDVFYLYKQSRRRAEFRAANSQNLGGTWDGPSADTGKRLARKKRATEPQVRTPDEEKLASRRTEVSRLVADHRLDEAATAYRALIAEFPDVALSPPAQLDVANQLYKDDHVTEAAKAYEVYLERYAHAGQAAEVRLILGLINVRRLDNPERGRELLERARSALRDPAQLRLVDELLAEATP